MIDYYKILGVDHDASTKDIKRAYKMLAQTLHPDKDGGIEEFKELQEAYRVLYDPEKRARYDRGEDASGLAHSPEAVARAKLGGMFQQLIDAQEQPADMDLLMPISRGLDATIEQLNNDIKKENTLIEKHTRLLDRIKYNGKGVDMFSGVLNQSLETSKKRIVALHEEIELVEAVIELVKDYECETEEAKPVVQRKVSSTIGGIRSW